MRPGRVLSSRLTTAVGRVARSNGQLPREEEVPVRANTGLSRAPPAYPLLATSRTRAGIAIPAEPLRTLSSDQCGIRQLGRRRDHAIAERRAAIRSRSKRRSAEPGMRRRGGTRRRPTWRSDLGESERLDGLPDRHRKTGSGARTAAAGVGVRARFFKLGLGDPRNWSRLAADPRTRLSERRTRAGSESGSGHSRSRGPAPRI